MRRKGTDLRLAGARGPGLAEPLHRQRQPVLGGVHTEDLDLHGLASLDHIRHILDEAILQAPERRNTVSEPRQQTKL